jgi:hypothetical protein
MAMMVHQILVVVVAEFEIHIMDQQTTLDQVMVVQESVLLDMHHKYN